MIINLHFHLISNVSRTDVNFVDALDLWDFFKTHNPSAVRSNCDVLLLSEYFIEKHPNSSFILDEVPSPKRHDLLKSKYKIL